MKLQMKILLPIISLIIILMAVGSVITYNISSSSLKNAIVSNMRGEANNMKRSINDIMVDAVENMERIAGLQSVTEFFQENGGDVNNMLTVLKRLEGSFRQFQYISMVDAKGVVIVSNEPGLTGRDFSSRPFVVESLAGKTFLTSPYKSPVTGQSLMVASAPVSLNGKVVGAIFGSLLLEKVYEHAVQHVRIGEKGFGYVADKEGRVVMIGQERKDWLFNPSLGATDTYKNLVSAPDGQTVISGNDGRPVVIYHAFDSTIGLLAMVSAEPDDVFAGLASIRNAAVCVAIAASLLGSLVVLLLVRPIVTSLGKGLIFAKDIASGNLDSVLDIKRKDEIGELSDALRVIPEVLKRIIAAYKQLETDIEQGGLDVRCDASEFSGQFSTLVSGTNSIMERFRTIIDVIPSPVVVLTPDGKCAFLNAQAKTVIGEDSLGKSWHAAFPRDDDDTRQDALRRSLESGQPATAETLARVGGRTMDIFYSSIPLKDNSGKTASVLQLITDLTEVKKTQRTIMEVATQATEISNRVFRTAFDSGRPCRIRHRNTARPRFIYRHRHGGNERHRA